MAPGWGHLVEQIDGSCTILASFTYDTTGTLSSVVLGNPNSGPRYYYAYDAQGNVVDVTDSSGTVVASYAYDAFGALTSSSESFPNGWSNPFRYDGAQGVRYDSETGLYWMSVRAYDPTLGRFISHDPLGRLAKLGLNMQPYVFVHNNPVKYTDPTGMLITCGQSCGSPSPTSGYCRTDNNCDTPVIKGLSSLLTPKQRKQQQAEQDQIKHDRAKTISKNAATFFSHTSEILTLAAGGLGLIAAVLFSQSVAEGATVFGIPVAVLVAAAAWVATDLAFKLGSLALQANELAGIFNGQRDYDLNEAGGLQSQIQDSTNFDVGLDIGTQVLSIIATVLSVLIAPVAAAVTLVLSGDLTGGGSLVSTAWLSSQAETYADQEISALV